MTARSKATTDLLTLQADRQPRCREFLRRLMLSASILPKAAAVSALVVVMADAQADLTLYTTQTSFLAAVTSAEVDTFNDLELDFIGSPITRQVGVHGYTATAAGFFGVGTVSDPWLSTNDAFEPIVIGFFTGVTQAVGGFFFATDLSGSYAPGQSIVVTAIDSAGQVTRTLANPTTTTFLGFVSDTTLSSLTILPVDTGSNVAWATLNNLTLASISAVPEPGIYLSLLGGIAAIAMQLRRRAFLTHRQPAVSRR